MKWFFLGLVGLVALGCENKTPEAESPVEVAKAEAENDTAPAEVADAPVKTAVAPLAGHTVFDFVDNRHLAHIYDGGVVLDMGAAGYLKYIQGSWNSPWHVGRTEGDFHYAMPKGVGGTLRFPLFHPDLTGETAEPWKMVIRLKPFGKQRSDLFFRSANGTEKKFASLTEIEDGWKTYTVTLPAGYQVNQEHTLRVHYSRSQDVAGGIKAAAAIDWIKVGPDATEDEPSRISTLFDATTKTMKLPKGARLQWYTTLANGVSLDAKVSARVDLHITPEGKDTKVFESSGGTLRADLGAFGSTPVRLEFVNKAEGEAVVTQPRLVAEPAKARERTPGPKYVLVWIIDTLRADHLPLYNPKTDVKTPNLDAWAKDAVVFERTTCQGNSSLPTSASIFTSTYLPIHQMLSDKARLPANTAVFAEPFKKAGWATALYSSNGYVSNTWGFTRGMDKEVNPIRENRPSDSEYLWPEAHGWLKQHVEANPDKPALLYVNTIDPHVPYDPPQEDLAHYYQGGRVGKVSPRATGQLLHDMAGGKVKLTADEAKYMHALYKGEITYNDVWFGKMLEHLDELGIRDQTMIIVSSDHGEEFGEYGKWGHGISVNQELVDIPLIVGYSPWTKGGVRVPDDVEVVDLLPTALDAAGIEIPASIQGRSLVSEMLDPTTRHPRAGFSYHNTFLRGARILDWKYQLFNGDRDPLFQLRGPENGWDSKDVSDASPIIRRMMRDAMAFQVGLDTQLKKQKHGFANHHSAELAELLDSKAW